MSLSRIGDLASRWESRVPRVRRCLFGIGYFVLVHARTKAYFTSTTTTFCTILQFVIAVASADRAFSVGALAPGGDRSDHRTLRGCASGCSGFNWLCLTYFFGGGIATGMAIVRGQT